MLSRMVRTHFGAALLEFGLVAALIGLASIIAYLLVR